MKQDWATKAAWNVTFKAHDGIGPMVMTQTVVKLLRQRDAKWKRAVKRLSMQNDTFANSSWIYQQALDDLIAAMKEERK